MSGGNASSGTSDGYWLADRKIPRRFAIAIRKSRVVQKKSDQGGIDFLDQRDTDTVPHQSTPATAEGARDPPI